LNNSLCILTDNSAQFPQHIFPGQGLIKTLPLHVEGLSITAPSVDDFLGAYRELEREFNAILVLTLSSHLLPVAEIAHQASLQHGGKAHINVLDSKQTSAGLGMLAQMGAQAALEGRALADVEQHLRSTIPHIYTLIHAEAQNLSRYGYFPDPQAGDALGMFPLFVLEDGQLVPYKKIRTRRHLLESFQEFIEEFETPQQIVFLRGQGNSVRARPLREIAKELFPETPFREVDMSVALLTLFGVHAVGITVMEIP
jgi:DegV family protein with EDD domain